MVLYKKPCSKIISNNKLKKIVNFFILDQKKEQNILPKMPKK